MSAVGRLGDNRRVIGQASFAWRERIAATWSGIEPHDPVVHEHTALRQYISRPKCGQEGLRDCGHVAVAIDHRKMRGASRRQMFAAKCAFAVGIAHILQAFLIGGLERECIGRIGGCIRRRSRRQQMVLKQPQRMRQSWPACQFRRRINSAASVRNNQWLTNVRPERGQIFDRKRTSACLDISRDNAGEVAFVEILRTLIGQLRQGCLQPVLRQSDVALDRPLRMRRQSVIEIGGRTRRIAP